MTEHALIVGAGSGLSASLARLFSKSGINVFLAARSTDKLHGLCEETGAAAHPCDVAEEASVKALFSALDRGAAPLDIVVYNPSFRTRGPFVSLAAEDVRKSLEVTAFGGFLVAQEAVKRMEPRGAGSILFTGASASIKGYPQSAPFAMGKFALRGLAQSLAREMAPKGIHIAHFVIDGGIASASRSAPADRPDSFLDPDAIASNYLHVLRQPRSAWTWEVELRPWTEQF